LSVDIVSLVYAADTTQLDKAEAAFQRVTAAVERNEAAARGQLTATERAGVTFGRAGQGASQFAASMGAVERANVQAARSMAEADRSASQALTLRMRLTRQQAQEEAAAARSAEAYANKVATIEKALSPAGAVAVTLAQRIKTLDGAFAAGAISAEKHATLTAAVTKAASAGEAVLGKYGNTAKLSGQQLSNLSFQLNDILTGIVSGQRLTQIAAQQGGQVFQALQMGAGGASGSIKALLSFLTPLRVTFGVVATAVVAATAAVLSYEASLDHLQKLTEGVGRQSGLAADQINRLAEANAPGSGASIAAARDLEAQLLQTGKVGGAVFADLIQIQRKYANATGLDLKAAQKELAASFADPAHGAEVLSDKLSGVDGRTAQLITTLIAQGRAFEAQQVLADAYKVALQGVGTTSDTLGGQLSQLGSGFSNFAGRIGEAIDNVRAYIALGPALYNTLKQQSEQQAKDRQTQASLNNASKAGSALYLQLDPDAAARRQLQANVSVASRGLAATGIQGDLQGALQNAEALERATRAQQSYVSATEKAHQLAVLDAQANEVNALAQTKATRARLGDIAAQRKQLELAGQPLTGAEVARQVADARQTAFTHQNRASPPPRDQTEQAIAAAAKAELSARLALTKNLSDATDLRVQEIAEELRGQIAQVETNKAIKSSEKPAIEGAYRAAAAAKREAAFRDELAGLIAQQLDQQRTLNGFADRVSSAQEAFAKNATDENAVATARLGRQQDFERKEQAYQDGLLVMYGQITQAEADRRAAALRAAQFGEALVQADQNRVRLVHEAAQQEQRRRQNAIDILHSEEDLATTQAERLKISLRILDLEYQNARAKELEVIAAKGAASTEGQAARERLRVLSALHANEVESATGGVIGGLNRLTDDIDGFSSALSRHDWGGLFQSAAEALAEMGASNGLTSGLSQVGGFAALGSAAGSGLASLFGGKKATGALVGAGAAALAGLFVAGPLGAIIGGIVGGAASLLGGKPSNKGAGIALSPTAIGALSGNKRDADTEQGAKTAAQAILAGEDVLRQAGITLSATVRGLVIGTRDLTQIYLTNGQTLTSAVGDVAAAAEAGLKGVLENATYTSDAQKQLVESMIAAGKGFDDITTALQNFAAAQGVISAISDQILQLTDPKAFDLKAVHDGINAQRDAAKAASVAGYLTADQLDTINGKLSILEGLQIDAVMKKYTVAVEDATSATDTLAEAQKLLDVANTNVDTAHQNLLDAYNAEADAKKAEIDRLQQASDSLKAFSSELSTGALAARGPASQYAVTRGAFGRLTALSPNDPTRLASIQAVTQAFLDASKARAPSALAYNRDLSAARRAVEASQEAAQADADVAKSQLDAMTAVVGQLVQLNQNVLTIPQAIGGLRDALVAQAVAQARVNAGGTLPANDNTVDIAKYLADNKDIGRYASDHGLDPLDFARQHYFATGQYEIAAGMRQFSTGGSFDVQGSTSGDQVPVGLMVNGGENVSISRADNMGRVARALEEQNALLREQNRLIAKQGRDIASQDKTLKRVTLGGTSLRTVAA
jgi:hypothetical protein